MSITATNEFFKEYIAFSIGKQPSKKEFLMIIDEKENEPNFTGDMLALLRTEIPYGKEKVFEWLKRHLLYEL